MFFKQKEAPRINQNPLLEPIRKIVADLHAQQNVLKKAALSKSVQTIAKYEFFADIVKNIDAAISVFNQGKKQESENELKEIGFLAIDIATILAQIQPEIYTILAKPRNHQRINANKCIQYGLIGTGAAAGATLGGPMVGAGLACGTGLVGYGLRSATGLSDIRTGSIKLLHKLIQHTDELLKYIYQYFNHEHMHFSIKFVDDKKPSYQTMQPNTIYIYLDNGSIVYALKGHTGKLREVNLDIYLDKNTLAKNHDPAGYKYENLDSLLFESYLEADHKHNDLEIKLSALTLAQQMLIYGAVYKSFLKFHTEAALETSASILQ